MWNVWHPRKIRYRFFTTVLQVFFISQAYRAIICVLSALHRFYVEFRGVCNLRTSDWSVVSTHSRAERWELGFFQGNDPELRMVVSPAYKLIPRGYLHPFESVDDPPPVPYDGQFARCTHQRFLCLKRLLLMQTRIKRA